MDTTSQEAFPQLFMRDLMRTIDGDNNIKLKEKKKNDGADIELKNNVHNGAKDIRELSEQSGLNRILNYRENYAVLRKFFTFTILICLSPVLLIVLYKYIFHLALDYSKNESLLYSLFCVVGYILVLLFLYTYLAFHEYIELRNTMRLREKAE